MRRSAASQRNFERKPNNPGYIGLKSVTDSAAFKKHKGIRLIVFKYLDAAALYHKIALLNKETREMITRVGQLDQQKTLTLKSYPSHMSRLHYAL